MKKLVRKWAEERVRMALTKTKHSCILDAYKEVERLDELAKWVTSAPIWKWRKRLEIVKSYYLSTSYHGDFDAIYRWVVDTNH